MKYVYGQRYASRKRGTLFRVIIRAWGFRKSTQDARLYFIRRGKWSINLAVFVDYIAMGTDRMGFAWAETTTFRNYSITSIGCLRSSIHPQLRKSRLRTPNQALSRSCNCLLGKLAFFTVWEIQSLYDFWSLQSRQPRPIKFAIFRNSFSGMWNAFPFSPIF